MFKNISLLSQRILRLTLIQIIFFVALFAGLAMMTLLLSVVMLNVWHWHPVSVLLVCILPWLLLVFALGLTMKIYARRVEKTKRDLFQFKLAEFVTQAVPLVISYFLTRKKR